MTRFQKLGYNVGDRFEYTGRDRHELRGRVFELERDDGSFCPYFRCLSDLRNTQYPQHYSFCFDAREITPLYVVEANE